MKIAIFEHEPWMEEYIQSQLPDHELVFSTEELTPESALNFSDAEIISVFVYSKINQQTIDAIPSLKMITTRSTGFDHIDLAYAKSKNIPVTNVPQYGCETVAEHTWALILSLSRKLFQSYERTEDVNWDLKGLRGMDLYGKTLGLVGLGGIGRNVALLSRGFNMKLRIFTRSKDHDFAKEFDSCVFTDKVEDVYSHSDVVTFHLPLTKETHHILNQNNYQTLKKGCVVVNTSRGGVVETAALVKGLKEGIIMGAGLDVLESEAHIKDEEDANIEQFPDHQELSEIYMNHMLIDMDNVILTPHNAFNSYESIRRLIDGNVQNIRDFIAGDTDKLDQVGESA